MKKKCLCCGREFYESKINLFSDMKEYKEYCAICNILGLNKLRTNTLKSKKLRDKRYLKRFKT
jgi:hypothetical protein